MSSNRVGAGVFGVAVTVAVLLAVDYWVVTWAFAWTEGAGWSDLMVVVPTFLAALAVGWVAGRLTVRQHGFVVLWSVGLFLLLRVGYTVGGWFHGGWVDHLFAVLLLPLAPALGFWLGARLGGRAVTDSG